MPDYSGEDTLPTFSYQTYDLAYSNSLGATTLTPEALRQGWELFEELANEPSRPRFAYSMWYPISKDTLVKDDYDPTAEHNRNELARIGVRHVS